MADFMELDRVLGPLVINLDKVVFICPDGDKGCILVLEDGSNKEFDVSYEKMKVALFEKGHKL